MRCAVLWATGHRYGFWKNVDNLPEVKERTQLRLWKKSAEFAPDRVDAGRNRYRRGHARSGCAAGAGPRECRPGKCLIYNV